MEARLRALGWRGGGASEKERKTMRAHVPGTLSRRDGGAAYPSGGGARGVSGPFAAESEGIGRRRNR